MSKAPATVFVVDDNAGVRSSLRELLTSVSLPVETFASGKEFLDTFDPDRAGCLILDVRLKEGSGLDLQDELRRRAVTIPIIVLTGHGDVPNSVRALKAGAFDFLQKPPPPAVLLERIHAALESDRAARETASERAVALRRLASLTPREREVMSLLVAGATSKEIASDLKLSVRTVEGHRRRVLSKLRVASAAQLVRVVLTSRGPDLQA
ncbi:MAG: response regulator transcription factor [Deltaproteobacteria bacterium]|nr:response regulator transcription factor [Deltaproteobacteria bacterium]